MAEKSQSPHPLAPSTNGYVRTDEESAATLSKELRRKKRKKCIGYILAFAVFQTGIILLFALTVMRFKNPKFRVRSASFPDTFQIGNQANPSFNLRMITQFGVKNTNFGHFKYEAGFVTFAYRGLPVGQVSIENGRARARSTKKVDVVVELNSNNLANSNIDLGRDISSGVLPLSSSSKLDGKIHLMKVIKKKKSAQMECTMNLVINTRTLENIVCK